MEKRGKKYIIKESELKEIIREMMLMEVYNPDDYKNMYTTRYQNSNMGDGKLPTPHDYMSNAWKGLMGLIIPEKWREKVAQGNSDVLQYHGEGSNADASQPLNVNAAVSWLRSHANPRYDKNKCGWCARYVRMALNRGGLQVPHGMAAPSAKYYVNVLPANGWEKIDVSQAGEPGDVVVIGDCIDSNGKRHNLEMGSGLPTSSRRRCMVWLAHHHQMRLVYIAIKTEYK